MLEKAEAAFLPPKRDGSGTDGPRLPGEAERYRLALEHAAFGVALVGLDGRPLYLNPAMARLSGQDGPGGDGASVFSVTHHDDLDRTRRLFLELLDGRRERYAIEKRFRRPDGSDTPARITVSLARDAGGTPLFAVVIGEDLTEVLELRERLARSSRFESLATLARGIAHDFNNILTTALGSLELLLAEPSAGPAARARAEDAMAALDRIRELTRQLQDYARGRRGRRTRFDAEALATEVARATLSGTATRWRVDARPGLPPLSADRAQVAQVLSNLLQNASQAMAGGGSVAIRIDLAQRPEPPGCDLPAGPRIRFSVKDEGPGIPAEIRSRIFDPCFTTRPGGSGLGLAICDSVVRAHHGRLGVQSVPGRGAEFVVELPVTETPGS